MSLADQASLLFIPSGYKSQKVYSIFPTDGDGDFDFSRSGSATRIAKNGLITTVDSNVPRLEYPLIDGVVNGCPSLLLEPQRTNLITYSEDFSQWSIFDNITRQANYGIAPDGTQNSFKIASSGAVNDFIYKSLSITPSTNYTISFFIKNIDSQRTKFYNPSQNDIIINWNGSNIQSITSGATYESFGNNWYRITTTSQSLSGGGLVVRFYPSTNNAASIEIFGYQLEAGSYATSYIPTNGSAVTRNAETCNGAGDAATFNDSEGVLMAEISALADDGTNKMLSLSDGSTNNRVLIKYDNIANRLEFFVLSGGSSQYLLIELSLVSTLNNKIAFKYKENDFSVWANGFELDTNTSGNTPIGLSELAFNDGVGGNDFYGNTKQIQYYNSALTDSELETLTSWTSFSDMAQAQQYSII